MRICSFTVLNFLEVGCGCMIQILIVVHQHDCLSKVGNLVFNDELVLLQRQQHKLHGLIHEFLVHLRFDLPFEQVKKLDCFVPLFEDLAANGINKGALLFRVILRCPVAHGVYKLYRFKGLFILAKLQTTECFANVAVLVLRVNLDGKIKPLLRIRKLLRKVVATADIVNTAQVVGIDLNTRQVVVKCNCVHVVFSVFTSFAVFRTVCLDQVPFLEPECGVFEDVLSHVRLNVCTDYFDFQVQFWLHEFGRLCYLEVYLVLADLVRSKRGTARGGCTLLHIRFAGWLSRYFECVLYF